MAKDQCRENYDYTDYDHGYKRKYRTQLKKVESAYKTTIGNIEINGKDSNGHNLRLTLFSKSGKKQIEKISPYLKEIGDMDVITTSHPSSQTYKYGEPTTIHVKYKKYDPKTLEGIWLRSDRAVGYGSDGIAIKDPIIIPDKKDNCKKK